MTPVPGSAPLRENGERHGTWYSFDTPYQRLELFSYWTIAGFGLAVCLALVLVYPHQTLEERLAASQHNTMPDRLTIEYLKVFLKAEPASLGLRSALVDQLVRLGSYGEAREALVPMLLSSNLVRRLDAQWLELKMREQEAFAATGDAAAQARALQAMRDQLLLLITIPQDSQHLLVLGRKALAAGSGAIAAKAFQQLAARPEVLEPAIYAEAAQAALGIGNYITAADLYFRAMDQSQAIDQRRSYFMTALKTLQASGKYDTIVPAADRHLGSLANDTPTLLFLARLAQAANQLDAAERYAKRLLQLSMAGQRAAQTMLASASSGVGWQTPAQFYAGLNRAPGPVQLQRIAADPGAVNPSGSASAGRGPALKFDEEAYALSYDIFVANRNLKDARRVAEGAVQQQPDNLAWRRRLAQVDEWSGDPAGALPHWLAYARLSGDEATWDHVMALAAGVADPAAQLAAIEHKAAVEPDNPVWLDRLLLIHENAGQPERALALLRSRVARPPARGVAQRAARLHALELLAGLGERTGNDAEVLTTLLAMQEEYGPRITYAMRIADQYYRTGQPVMALRELTRATPVATENDTEFWRTYADLAGLLQDDSAKLKSLRRLLVSDQENNDDLSNLITVLETDRPAAAARLAEFTFARSGDVRYAALALSLRARIADWSGARALLARLTPDQRSLLEKNASFLAVRASVAQAGSDVPAATRDMRAALALRPNDTDIRAGLIWLLIAARDGAALKQVLPAWAHDAETNPALWDPYAAALMTMNRQGEALHWFRKSGFQRNDYLWLMTYAEALDATAQQDLAWRIRRRAWLDLRKPEVLRNASADSLIALRDRLVAVAPLFMSGDGAQRVMQALLRADVSQLKRMVAAADAPRSGKEMLALLDQAGAPIEADREKLRLRAAQEAPAPLLALLAPGEGSRPQDDVRLSAAARELALAYALSRESNDLASAWFATRFASQVARPVYATLALALQADDRAALDRLLDDLPDWLPMADRIEAAERAGRPALAQTLAFEQLVLLPNDDALHLRLTSLMTTGQAPHLAVETSWQKQSPLSVRQLHAQATVDLSPGLKATLDLIDRNNSSLDAAALRNLPATDREASLSLRRQLDRGAASVTLSQRQAAKSNLGLRLEYSLAVSPSIGMAGAAELRQLAGESALLRVAGMRRGLSATVNIALTRAEFARFGVSTYRYASQAGTVLGTGMFWNAEAGLHLRIEYPNLTMRVHATGSHYHDRGQADAVTGNLLQASVDPATFRVLPTNDTLVGLSLGAGTTAESGFTRGWRPYAEVGTTFSRTIGSGYNLRAGVAGSVLGQDLMRLRGLRASGTTAAPQGLQEFGIDYNWFF